MALESDVTAKHSSAGHSEVIVSQLRAGSIGWLATPESLERRGLKRFIRREDKLGTTPRSLNLRPAAWVPKLVCVGSQVKDRGIYEANRASYGPFLKGGCFMCPKD